MFTIYVYTTPENIAGMDFKTLRDALDVFADAVTEGKYAAIMSPEREMICTSTPNWARLAATVQVH